MRERQRRHELPGLGSETKDDAPSIVFAADPLDQIQRLEPVGQTGHAVGPQQEGFGKRAYGQLAFFRGAQRDQHLMLPRREAGPLDDLLREMRETPDRRADGGERPIILVGEHPHSPCGSAAMSFPERTFN